MPEILEQVEAFSETITPGLLKHSIILHASFKDGTKIPRGSILRISPDEYPHAIVLKIAKLIKAGTSDEDLVPYLRMLLSCPATFRRLENNDELYAEANSCRQDFIGKAALATHSARQIVCNIWGFEMRKGPSMSAAKIAEFWMNSVRVAPSQSFMTKNLL